MGKMPHPQDIDLTGLTIRKEDLEELLTLDKASWEKEAEYLSSFFKMFGERLPPEITQEIEALKKRLATYGK